MWTRATALLLLVSFCASSLPIPIQSFAPLRIDSSESYPCKGGACGCKSARQCWTSCCCNSPAKRAAWARKNGVTPPSYAILEEPTKVNHQSDAALRKKISSNVRGDSCCGASNKKDKEACLLASCTSKTKVPVVHRKTNKNLVLTMFALKCQGKDSVFTHFALDGPVDRTTGRCVERRAVGIRPPSRECLDFCFVGSGSTPAESDLRLARIFFQGSLL